MSFEDTAKADFEKAEDKVKKAEENAIKWFHEQRVAQHNEAVGAIKDNNDNQPKTVSSVDELPVYNPDAVIVPVSTPVQTPTSGVPDNVGHGTVTVVDPPKEEETSTDVEHPADQSEAATPEAPVTPVAEDHYVDDETPIQPVVVEQHETQQV